MTGTEVEIFFGIEKCELMDYFCKKIKLRDHIENIRIMKVCFKSR